MAKLGHNEPPAWQLAQRGGSADAGPIDAQSCILAVAQSDDRRAFAWLFQRYAPRMKAYFQRLGLEEDMAEELAQEAMLRVWRKAELYDPSRTTASGWLFTLARNLCIDHLRREAHPDALSEASADGPPTTPEDMADRAQRDALVRDALKRLPSSQAEAIKLSVWDESSHAQISARLGLPLGTVKSHIRRAAARLRLILLPYQ